MDEIESIKRELLAYLLEEALDEAPEQAPAPERADIIVRVDRNTAIPLSFAQQRLWFLDQLDHAAGAAYHMPAALRLTGDLDRAALQAALDRIVARHESLRTTFKQFNGQPVQRIAAPDCGFVLTPHDLRTLGPEQQQEQVRELAAAEAVAPFDLATGPLIRGRLIQLSAHEHILLVTQHHIVTDGWSIGVLVREVGALYTAFSQGHADPLPELPLQYADYAAWQRQWLQGDALHAQVRYWKEHLAGAPALLTLPTDRPRPAVQGYAGGVVPFVVPADVAATLRALAQRHGATLFMTMLAAWAVLLSRLSGQTDVVIGVPVANRRREETESMIGFFVNTLAVRVRLDEDLTVGELMARVKADTLGAYAHQDLPFDQVVEALNPMRSMSHSPIFQAMLNMNNLQSGREIQLPGMQLEQVTVASTTIHFDLSLTLSGDDALHSDEPIHGGIAYASDLFDEATVRRFVSMFQTLLRAMGGGVLGDAQRVDRLDLLDEAARRQVLVAFNQTATASPDERLLHRIFEDEAALHPDAPAVVYEHDRLSFGELNRRANRLAHMLIERGVGPDNLVALYVERSVDMFVGILGILKAGGAYVPLDPNHPQERLAYMLGDCEPVAVVSSKGLAEQLPATAVPALLLEDAAVPADGKDHNPEVGGLTGHNLAYVIYTSGSTGDAKGVMVEHRSPVNFWHVLERTTHRDCTPGSNVALNAAYSFDMSLKGILQLLSGRCVVVIPQAIRADGPALLRFLAEHRVEAFDCTPSQLGVLLACGLIGNPDWQPISVLIGGEPIDAAMWNTLKAARDIRFYNMYGPTECTVDATICQIREAGDTPNIGWPIANVQIYILDRRGQPVPPGVAGEIHIGGAGVARGYLHRPDMTGERFVPDPFSTRGGARMYKTGDLGRWLPDGRIEYLGRNDFQVKLRGYRIELGEIEARLRQCEGVREAVVLAREDAPGDKRLVAYVVPDSGATLSAAGLRMQLTAMLAEYMVPSAFVMLETMPLTPNGKVDRKALPVPDQSALASRAYEAPRGEVETAIAGIWQQLLGVEMVGRHDQFFELGGHSLLAVQFISRVRQMLGVEVMLRELFAQPSLSGFASTVARARRADEPPMVPADRGQELPLSWAQQRLWFLDQLDHAAGAAYHMPAALRLSGALDREALQATLNRIVARHENLRTTFVQVDGRPVQRIAAPDCGFALTLHDLRSLGQEQQHEQVRALAAAEAASPFDLATGPLIRGRLIQLADREHILLVTQHHIISDGWSIGVLIREVGALYSAFSQGQDDPLPPLALQYADYAAWQRQWLQGDVLERQLDFWRSHLNGAPELLTLPTDRARPATQSYRGASVAVTLSPELSTALGSLAQRHGCTLFMTLFAGWAVLMARLSGQDDVVIGTPVANRQRVEIESLIGFFVNSLAVRVRLDDDPGVGALLERVRATMLDAYTHQDVPFEQVVEAVQPVRSLSHSPLFQTMFTLNSAGDRTLTLPDLSVAPFAAEHGTTHFDLSLSLTDTGAGIAGAIEYASDLFEASTMARMAGYFERLLGAMVADETQHVSRIGLMSDAQRHRLVVEFNATETDYPSERLIHQLFEAQALVQPHATAVVFEERSMSFGELNRKANLLAHRLIGLGVKPDDRVAICAERSMEMVVGLLGILKAGGAYVPLDPAYPEDRLSTMLEDCAPKAVVAPPAHADRFQAGGRPVLVIDLRAAEVGGNIDNPVVEGLRATHLACVFYTSGSSGQPKGVMVEHRNVLRLTTNSRFAPVGPGDCLAHCASPSFDAITWEIWGALLNGASLLIVAQDVLLDPVRLNDALLRGRASALFLTTALFNAYLDTLRPSLSRLKYFLFGGEFVDPRHVARALQGQSPRQLIHCYGPTESTTFATTGVIAAVSPAASSVPIGRPIANTTVYILDRHLQPVPLGAVGEIYIGGAGVARGYLNRPELTAERFIADPFGTKADARMYKTGDLGRWLDDGSIDFIGRNDFQVKLRGFRIELAEIEAHLRQCEGVREAAVVVREDAPGDKRLVAYLVPGDGAVLSASELRTQLSAVLAEYMVPSAFVTLEALPLTPNGKVDRNTLPAPDQSALASRVYEAPQGELETAIAGIWQLLLGVETVGRHDQFFELGGHSLLAVQFISRVRQMLGVEVTLRDLFAQPSLSGFASTVAKARRADEPPITPADRSDALPLSWAQQRLWFLDQLDHAAGAAYHMPAALRLSGELDRAALMATLDRIVARHENLRTTFVQVDGQPVQRIAAPDCGFALTLHDLQGLGQEQQHEQVRTLAAAEATSPFDLAAGPLIRGQLIQLSDREHILLVTQHHIISDGWSIGVLIREVGALYSAFSQGQDDPLPALAVQYADYAAWQRQWLQGDVLERQLDFWRSHLDGAPELLTLPTDRARPATPSYRGASVNFRLSAELSTALGSLAQRHGCTLFMTLFAGWAVLMARLSGQDDVVIGTPVANRQRLEIESLIGFFVNSLAVRVRLDDDPGVGALLERVRSTMLDAYTYQDVPFEQVVEAVQPARSLSHSPLFQTMFTLDSAGGIHGMALPGLDVAPVAVERNSTHFDLSLSLTDTGMGIVGTIDYASDLFDADTVARMAGYFERLLAAMVADEAQQVSRIDLLSEEQRDQLVVEFNATDAAYPSEQMVHQLFEAQAQAQPEATALVFEERTMSYGELNRKANQVAHRLVRLGVQPDVRVAICAERGIELIVGLLGILKAGGAYVPLDPAYPQERLAFMLEDCAPVAVLAEPSLRERLPALAMPVIALDDGLDREDEGNPVVPGLTSSHLAYVIYTSGSTGTPKGVMVGHRNVVQLVMNEPCVEFGPDACVAYCANPAFDASTWEIWGALLNGARLLIISQAVLLDAAGFARELQRQRASIVQLTVGLFNQYADALAGVLPQLEYVLFGGDRADMHKVMSVFRTCAPRHLVHTYGPTETIAFTTTHAIGASSFDGRTLPIGRPIANTAIYILDQHLQPVPLGAVGEIYIGGAGVARGYLNRPELTAERFVADPFSDQPGARMYKTGDLGRWLDDGEVEFIGRNDFQVKLRGFRIELGEIEARLQECEGVREAVVLAREDAPGDKRLVAYLVADEGVVLSAADLRAQLSAVLAEYMVPSAFVTLEALPLTPNGKVDRKALPAPDQSALASRVYEAPQGELETAIAGIWQDLLGVEKVGRHDQFFELGGHSLLAVQFISRVRQMLGVEVTLRELFAQPSLSGFAGTVAKARRADEPAMMSADRSHALPLSWAQQRLWFLDQLDHAAGAAYRMPAALRLSGELDRAALMATLDRIVARHENLRTTFVQVDGQPVQRIAAPDCGFALTLHDVHGLGEDQQHEQVRALTAAEAASPFDLAAGPLIRGQLIQLSDREHILLVTQHHIISDGWSIGVLIREVGALYSAFSQGQDDPLPALALQYADYAAWQRQWLQGDVLERQLDFWRTHLNGAPELLTLPTDRARPATQSYRGASVPVTLSPELSTALGGLAQRHGCTLFMTLFAGWAVLMARLSGQDDVVIGTPVANRQRLEIESLIGFFVNSLAVRVRLDDDPGVGALLERVRATMLDAYTHQDVPFEQVVEAVQPARSLSHSPLFQTMFTLNSASADGALMLPGLSAEQIAVEHGTTHFDLSLSLTDTGAGILGTIDYASDLFDADTVARMAGYFERLLAAMAADEAQQVSRIGLLSAEQRDQLVVGFNATDATYPSEQLIHQLFEMQAASQPDAVALVFEARTMSYGELNRKANQLAHRLIGLGVQPDDRVAICAERSMDMVIGLLGILKAGGAYVPLDPNYPQERLAYMLADSAPVAVLTQGPLRDHLPALAGLVVYLDDGLDQEDDGDPVVPALTSSHLAYVIYTSGSTGMPKGVMNQHDGVVNRLHWAQQKFGLDGQDRVLQKTPFGFDVSVWEFFLTLGAGATLVIAPPGAHQEPEAIAGLVERHGVTMLHFVPSMLQAFVSHNQVASLAKVQHIICSGEALPYALRAQVHAELPQVRLHNLYGPTEAAVDVSCWSCEADKHVGITPIGKPVANTRLYLLDAHQQPVPLGVVGEIYIGGVQVARGYLNRPELTAERFVADPFSTMPDARMYKTGDLGRWLDDGNIEYLGRNDFQVKLRGLRIELGEIEARLLECEGVREAVVVAREDSPGDKRLVAYLVPDDGTVLSVSELRTQLLAVLAEYMVPSAFVMLEAMPLTPNGKVDRKALPAPDQSALASRVYEAPQGELETAIAGIWQDLLGVEKVGRHDQFFELGGHSLLAVQFISRVRQMLGVEVTLRELFAQPSLSGFASTVAKARQTDEPPMMPADRSQELPLSWAQQRLWFLNELDHAAGAAYHMPAALRLSGELDRAALMATLDRIVARHENLRTTFVQVDGQPVQRIAAPDCGFALTLHSLGQEQQHEQVRELAAAEAASPFDLATGPLIRGRLIQLSDREHILLVTQHHIISDGWSIDVLIREVGALYTAFSQGLPDPLPPLEFQYADYAAWQRQWLQGDVLERQLDFWRSHLNGAPELLTLPTDRARPARQSYRGASVAVTLSPELSTALGSLAQRHGCTLFMTLFAGWAVLMARLSGQDDVVIGTPVANRQRLEIESLIGFFVNSLAVRVRLDDDPRVGALLERVRTTMLDAYMHQDVPFEQVVEAVQPVRSLSHSPLFQTMFTLNSASANGALNLPGLGVAPVTVERDATHFDLSLSLTDTGAGIVGTIDYASDLFDADTVARMAGYLEHLLDSMAGSDARQISRIALLSSEQRDQMVTRFNATQTAYPTGLLIHQLFEAQAAARPDAVALVFEDQHMSYEELNRRANQIAHGLIGMGVRPDDRVAVFAERSMHMVIGLLGILKAGGAYVPLDPGYPEERLVYMLDDCAPIALLTQARLHDRLPVLPVPVIDLDDAELDGEDAGDNPIPAGLGLTPGHLAYVIYTSGSTGMPKGVMNQHDGVVNRLHWAQQKFALDGQDRVLQKTPFGFDVSVWEFFLTLGAGATLVIAPPGAHQEPEAIAGLVERHGVTMLHFVPSMLQAFVAHNQAASLAKVQHIICSGEALPYALRAQVHAELPQVRLHNLYGPTEAAVDVSCWTCEPDKHVGITPIGKPIANTRLYLLDAHQQPVPLGVVGELYIGGVQVARGYLNRPELTAERFVADPFSTTPDARMYKTGDLGRWLDDGNIEYVGRNDFQVKLRGFRIELGEIEARLLECEGVREAVVVMRGDAPGHQHLVAYFVAHEGTTVFVHELRLALQRTVPSYMVPSFFVQLNGIPLSANGKLDRSLLPAPDGGSVGQQAYSAPHDGIERTVAEIWQEILGVEKIGRNDDFFDLGGHSLLVHQMMARVFDSCRVKVSFAALFENPRLYMFARIVKERQMTEFFSEADEVKTALAQLSKDELLAMLKEDSSNV